MTKDFYEEFQEGSSKLWKQKIQVDLKGADYNETLVWKTNEGIDVKPFYHADEFTSFLSGPKSKASNWRIAEEIDVTSITAANSKALNATAKGAEAIIFNLLDDSLDLSKLVSGIDFKKVEVIINCQCLSKRLKEQVNTLQEANNDTISIHCDIIHNLAKSGNWHKDLKTDHSYFEAIIENTKSLSVDLTTYQNAGATMIQQLAYGLAHANEYLNHFDNDSYNELKKDLDVTFTVAVGANYFFEIAKIRALRKLWSLVAQEYNVKTNCTIVAKPSKRNKTIYDYNVNMLRTTTECMSAILGGADIVSNMPYDALYHKSNDFGDRIARNQLLILKHESYFNKVNNPAEGAYYIESLTEQLTEKALKLFKDIEANGGFLAQLKNGKIQQKIKESAAKEQSAFNSNKIFLVGTNKHPNPNDRMKGELEKHPFLEIKSRKTLIEPIIEKRLAETLEQNRLKDE
ncbi:MAG: methylmalonyl-CoA mutase [Winogradskyella sp.]|nr:methylmalonyl-CoA mutase [Winogradskyella sp.]